jgi:cell wall-associated NlpC family hydrolase
MGAAWAGSSSSGSSFAASMAGLLSGADPTTAGTTRSATGADVGGAGAVGGALGTSAVALARTYTGVPYKWGGTDPSSGLDCSGLVQLVYRKLGVDLPRTSQQQQHKGTEVASLAQAQPGDLVFFGEPAHHVGIYVGDGKMIDAPRAGKTVGVHPLYGTPSHIRRLSAPSSAQSAGLSPALSAGQSAGQSAGFGAPMYMLTGLPPDPVLRRPFPRPA